MCCDKCTFSDKKQGQQVFASCLKWWINYHSTVPVALCYFNKKELCVLYFTLSKLKNEYIKKYLNNINEVSLEILWDFRNRLSKNIDYIRKRRRTFNDEMAKDNFLSNSNFYANDAGRKSQLKQKENASLPLTILSESKLTCHRTNNGRRPREWGGGARWTGRKRDGQRVNKCKKRQKERESGTEVFPCPSSSWCHPLPLHRGAIIWSLELPRPRIYITLLSRSRESDKACHFVGVRICIHARAGAHTRVERAE